MKLKRIHIEDFRSLERLELNVATDALALFGLNGEAGEAPKAGEGTADQSQAMDLPQTATGFMGTIKRGFATLALGLAGLFAFGRRRKPGEAA